MLVDGHEVWVDVLEGYRLRKFMHYACGYHDDFDYEPEPVPEDNKPGGQPHFGFVAWDEDYEVGFYPYTYGEALRMTLPLTSEEFGAYLDAWLERLVANGFEVDPEDWDDYYIAKRLGMPVDD